MEKCSEEELREYNLAQIEEIKKHKWIESEKAGHDIGEFQAAVDWVSRYAGEFKGVWCIPNKE